MELKFDLTLPHDLSSSYEKSLENLKTLYGQNPEEAKGLAWFDWPEKGGFELLEELKQKTEEIDFFYDLVVVLGIGGSYLGTKAINDLFGRSLETPYSQDKRRPIIFLGNNLSENDLLNKLAFIKEHSPVFCVVSKSGSTVEPMAAYCMLQKELSSQMSKEEFNERTFVITEARAENHLFNKTQEEQIKVLTIPEEMGGRFSVLSAASLVPLALAGINVRAIMQGAKVFFAELKEHEKQKTLPVIQYAAARFVTWTEGKRIELLAYNEPALAGFASWWQQLFAESEGKNAKGLFPTTSLFSTDLHSLGQYLQQGFPSIFETFLVYENYSLLNHSGPETRLRIPSNLESRALLGDKSGHYFFDLNQKIMAAARKAHSENKTPSCLITLPRMNERNLGYLLAFMQTACFLSARLLEVNPFDQPGVEVYKKELQQLTMT